MTLANSIPYIGKMISDKEIFSIWLKMKMKGEDAIAGNVLAPMIGVHPSTISGWFSGKSKGPGKPLAKKICKIIGGDYDNIIKEYKDRHQEHRTKTVAPESDRRKVHRDKNIIDSDERRNAEHHRMVDRFKDQETALAINSALVDIESLDRDEFEEVLDIVKAKRKKLMKKIPGADNQGERNTKRG